jgi:hypothetical protein
VAQRGADLGKELGFDGLVGGRQGQDLLELVKDQDCVLIPTLRRLPTVQVVSQAQRGQLLPGSPPLLDC